MAVYEIPTLKGDEVDTHDYSIRVSLAQQKWNLRFLFNERRDVWTLTVTLDGESTPLVQSAPLFVGVDVLPLVGNALLPGRLEVLPHGPVAVEPGLRGLGAWCALYYVTPDETFEDVVPVRPRRL